MVLGSDSRPLTNSFVRYSRTKEITDSDFVSWDSSKWPSGMPSVEASDEFFI